MISLNKKQTNKQTNKQGRRSKKEKKRSAHKLISISKFASIFLESFSDRDMDLIATTSTGKILLPSAASGSADVSPVVFAAIRTPL